MSLKVYYAGAENGYHALGWYVYDKTVNKYLQKDNILDHTCGWFNTRKEAREARYKFLHPQKEGICPKCGAPLSYGGGELADNQYYYEVECLKCGFEGKEWYSLKFEEIIQTN
jgi:hypothetical protein